MIIYVLHSVYLVLVCSTILMFTALNPVNAIILLISVFFNTAMCFMIIGVDFIGILLLLVYVGAIAVLFLFIIMMLNVRRIERDTTMYLLVGLFIIFLLFFQFQYVGFKTNVFAFYVFLPIQTNFFSYIDSLPIDEGNRIRSVTSVGMLIFGKFFIALILASGLLFVALVGAILLTNEKRGYFVQQQYSQLLRIERILNSRVY